MAEFCLDCGRPTAHRRASFCPACSRLRKVVRDAERERTRSRDSSAARGYGAEHRRLRERYKREVEMGISVCARCFLPIAPDAPWDLGHDDHDRTQYTGPEHMACNRATAGRRSIPTSRSW